MSSPRRERGAVCGALALAAAGLLGALTQPWADIAAARQAPLPDLLETVGGRSLAPALGGAALVGLAGAVAVLATDGWARRVVGVLLAATGSAAMLGAVRLIGGPSDARARQVIADRTSGVGLGGGFPVEVTAHPAWPLAAAALSLVIAAAGVAVAIRGPGWSALSSRYEAPGGSPLGGASGTEPGAATDLALWAALDRGHDPTDDPTDVPAGVPAGVPTGASANGPAADSTGAPAGVPTGAPAAGPTDVPTDAPAGGLPGPR